MFAASKTASVSGEYQISRSLRFNSADSAYLNRTPATTTNRRTFTFSAWVKFSKTSDDPFLMGAGSGGQIWVVGDKIRVRLNGSPDYYYDTSAVFRDYSAWYHIVVGVDTTNATSADRVKIYVNSTQQAIGASSAPPQNYDTEFNLASTGNNLGKWPSGSQYLNGYMTEINFIDGQALTPSSFGETNAQTGVWQPKAYSGSYGTNGFYLNFSDNSNTTAATLGKDYSGNGNNWTPNNFSVTAGAGNDSLVDSPTSYGVDTGVGGEVRGNYCTLNPLRNLSGTATLTNGNLDFTPTSGYPMVPATFGMTTGKWYWENTLGASGNVGRSLGIVNGSASTSTYIGDNANGWGYYTDGRKLFNATGTAYGATFTNGDTIGVAFDADAGTLVFYKNGASQGTAFNTGLTSGPYFPAVSAADAGQTGTTSMNFGQRPFAYTAPSGFKALCTQNLPTPTIGATTATQAGKFFNPATYTGNGSTNSITTVGFQPDWTWLKNRSVPAVAGNHFATDAVRGAGIGIYPNLTDAEANNTTLFTGFTSTGFNVAGTNSSLNENGVTYVSWNWKANGSGSSNTAGQITSTVSASTTSGFSIVTFTTDGTTKTVGHGLGVKPSLVIVKVRNGAGSWIVMTDIINGSMQYGALNSTAAFASIGYSAPTSTVFQYNDNNGNTQVAYCFASIDGYSKIGTYTGNGSADGAFVFTGFRPAYVMIKRTSSTGDWFIYNNKTSPSNVVNLYLTANTSGAEGTYATLDFLSNGFKLRVSDAEVNGNGSTFIFMAFAEVPTKFALAR